MPQESLAVTIEKMAIPICGTIVAVELISRFLGARSARVAVHGTVLGGVIYLVIGMVPVFLGLVGPGLLPNVEESEQIVAKLAKLHLPGLLYVAFAGAIISAILSTVHSALHAPAAQISHNIVVRLIPGLSERGKLWCVRLTVMALSIVAYFLSVTSERIHDLVETASAFGSAGVFVTALFALFTRFGGPASAYASVAAGLLVWAAGKYALGPEHALSAGIAGRARRLRRRRLLEAPPAASRPEPAIAGVVGRPWHFAAAAAFCLVTLNSFETLANYGRRSFVRPRRRPARTYRKHR